MSLSDKPQPPSQSAGDTGIRDARVFPRRPGIKIAKQILDELSNPENWDRLKHTFVNTRTSAYNLGWWKKVQVESGISSYNQAQTFVIESFVRTRQLSLPVSNELLFADDRPALLTSGSGTGKTLWTKTQLLQIGRASCRERVKISLC